MYGIVTNQEFGFIFLLWERRGLGLGLGMKGTETSVKRSVFLLLL